MLHIVSRVRFVGLPLLALLLALVGELRADVRLPGFFGDHMVLQQKMPLRIWGWAESGESVTVALGENVATTKADDDGRWQVKLAPVTANKTPMTLNVSGNNRIEIDDVLIGEVWLCSGQSNMEWPVSRSSNAEQEIASASHPMIRHIKIAHRASPMPLDDVSSQWQLCSPETVAEFTACGYFMARRLQKELDVPIGLVNSSWGGTRVEPWTPPVGFQQTQALGDIYQSVIGRTPGTEEYRAELSKHIAATEAWLAKSKRDMDANELIQPSPPFPESLTPFSSHQQPTMLYNGMIHALVGFPIRGAIWYQGEANQREGMLYYEKKKALIGGWRKLWDQGDFPFYYVQIAPFRYRNKDQSTLAEFWEAQAATQQIPRTGMVVINDIATVADIHPPNKQDVGQRLALLALKNDYGRDDLVAVSPQFEGLEITGDQLKVTFNNTGGGLKTRDGKSPSHFEIIGAQSGGFQPAEATLAGDAVILKSDLVKNPVAFRFAWNEVAEPNLSGATGLPVGAVRGGQVPDFINTIPGSSDYQLVYDLDLSRLQKTITYDADHSSQVGPFDRIAYLVELDSQEHGQERVFVSMEAFTDDIHKIGIPTASSNAHFQQTLKGLAIHSSVDAVTSGSDLETGNIEFWPNNYAPGNGNSVKGAASNLFDFGDEPGPPLDGYGSMQIHNHGAKQTVFAINHWSAGAKADLGIGNSTGGTRDWTFTGNAGSYKSKRLRVYVRPKK